MKAVIPVALGIMAVLVISGCTSVTECEPDPIESGIYMFRIVVCENSPCTDIDSPYYYGSAQFTIEIEDDENSTCEIHSTSDSDFVRRALLDGLAGSDAKVGVAAPDVAQWKRGDTGSYAVGVRNVYPETDKTFYINIYLEDIGGDLSGESVYDYRDAVKEWPTFPSTMFVPKNSSETFDVIIKPKK